MRYVRHRKRVMLFILSIAMLLQCGFVMPSFAADEKEYDFYLHYMTGDYTIGTSADTAYINPGIISIEHPMIVPPEADVADYRNQMQNQTSLDYAKTVKIDGPAPEIPKPYRILGYTFEGWYYNLDFSRPNGDPFANATKYEGGTITQDMVGDDNAIRLYARWQEFHSPIISDGSVSFTLKNEEGAFINDPIVWTNENDEDMEDFDSDVTDYYGYVYSDVAQLTIDFEQYDPGRVEIVRYFDTDYTGIYDPDWEGESEQEWQDADGTRYRYANHGTTELKYNNVEQTLIKKDVQLSDVGTGYRAFSQYKKDESTGKEEFTELPYEDRLVTGINLHTANYMKLDFNENEDGKPWTDENVIEITVTLPEHAHITSGLHYVTKTYRFHIKRFNMELKAGYGNTPYGRIMETMESHPDRAEEQKKSYHENGHNYSNYTYFTDAWNIYGDEGINVPLGSTPGENEFINYDEDETAIVVTEGEKFNDPGVLLYKNGAPIEATGDVKRTVNYTTIKSLRYGTWENEDNFSANKSEEDIIPIGLPTKEEAKTEGARTLDILVNNEYSSEYVKPGIYTIDYEYKIEGISVPVKTHRSMIVMPKQQKELPSYFDINMDNFINALDALMYDEKPELNNSVIENVFLYRVFDANNDGVIDNTDKNRIMNGDFISSEIYPSLAIVEKDSGTGEMYEIPEEVNNNRVQLYMDFLGTDRSALDGMTPDTRPDIEETKLKKGDTFYIGYRFTNLKNLTKNEKSALLHEIVLTTSVDTRYLSLDCKTNQSLLSFLKDTCTNLYKNGEPLFNVTMKGSSYSIDKTTAFVKWNNIGDRKEGDPEDPTNIGYYYEDMPGDTSAVQTTLVEMYLKDMDNSFELNDNEYLLKLPVKVAHIPPQGPQYTLHGERKTISAKLGANTFNFAFGGSYGYMWDMSHSLNASVTENLLEKLDYMGDIKPAFEDEDDAQKLTATYKTDYTYTVGTGIFEGFLPKGVKYMAGMIVGSPEECGDFEFYVDGKRYKLTVKKKIMRVRPIDKTMTYGDSLPFDPENPVENVDYEFVEEDFGFGDDSANQEFGKPTLSCAVNERTPYRETPYDINVIEMPESENYEFEFVKGSIKVERRLLYIEDILKDMPDYYVSGEEDPVPSTISLGDNAIYSTEVQEFTTPADRNNVVNGDAVQIHYTVQYLDYKGVPTDESDKLCSVKIIVNYVSHAYGQGNNYDLDPSTIEIGDKEAHIRKGVVVDFFLEDHPKLIYTHGDMIDFSTGKIQVVIQTGLNTTEEPICTFEDAMNKGITLTLVRTDGSTQPLNDKRNYILKRDIDDGAKIYITCGTVNNWSEETSELTVNPMPITIRADDKERFYGDSNTNQLYPLSEPDGTPGGLTYSITAGEIVTAYETQQGVLTDNITYNTADSYYDIDMADLDEDGRGSTIVPIELVYSGTNYNYAVTIEAPYDKETNPDGSKLKIKQRPLYIKEFTAPVLTAPDYIDENGNVSEISKDITGFVTIPKEEVYRNSNIVLEALDLNASKGLIDGEKIKIDYTVRYIDTEPQPEIYNKDNVKIQTIGMDTSYEKSRNYYLAEEIESIIGSRDIRRIDNVEVIHEPMQHYFYGEPFELSTGDDQQKVVTTHPRPESLRGKSWLRITYDTGEIADISFAELCDDFEDKVEYNDNFVLTITINGTTKPLNKTFMDSFNTNASHFNAGDDVKITFGMKNGETLWEKPITIDKRTVNVTADNKSFLYRDTSYTINYTCTPDESDFQWGDSKTLTPAGTYDCREDNNVTPVSINTPAGIYTINLSIADTANYTFACKPGTLSIRQRPLIITDIAVPTLTAINAKNNNLSGDKTAAWTGTDNGGITFASGFAPFDDETVTIKYTYTYTAKPREGGPVDVTLSNVSLDRMLGDARNYYLQSVAAKTTGEVESALIKKLAISYIQGTTDGSLDWDKTDKYVYGDTLDISGMRFSITYDTDEIVPVNNIESLAEYGIKLEYCNAAGEVQADKPVKDGIFLTREYNGLKIRLSLIDDNGEVAPAISENAITVNKRLIHVGVNDSSYTYGEEPPSTVLTDIEYGTEAKENVYTYYLYTEDFPQTEGKTQADFFNELPETDYPVPTIIARTQNGEGDAPDKTTDATAMSEDTIKITADVSGKESENYVFAFDDEPKTLTINQRVITATAIDDSIIPPLTADLVHSNNDKPPITIRIKEDSAAEVTHDVDEDVSKGGVYVTNMANGDKLAFIFDVKYNTVKDTGTDHTAVDILNFKMLNKYDSKNYILASNVPKTANGTVITSRLRSVIIRADEAPKLSYTYGELLSIDGAVRLDYTSNERITVALKDLYKYGLELLFVKEGTKDEHDFKASDGKYYIDLTDTLGTPEKTKLLTVKNHNGIKLCVRPIESTLVDDETDRSQYAIVTQPLEVKPKTIRLTANDLEMVYSENVPPITWNYNWNDLVNGDTLTSSRFTVDSADLESATSENHLKYIYITEDGTENGTRVSNTTAAEKYGIIWSDSLKNNINDAANYSIKPENGTLTIKKKPLRISAIHNVPNLTPGKIVENGGIAPITIHHTAKYPDKDYSGNPLVNFEFEDGFAPVNGDSIEISYDVVYKTVRTGATTVTVQNVKVTDYGRSGNYTVESAPYEAEGSVSDSQIAVIEILADPVMRDDNPTVPIAYTYGDSLNLNRGLVRITYNNGASVDVPFSRLADISDGVISLVYADGNGNNLAGYEQPYNGQTMYVSKHNGRYIKISVPDNSDILLMYKGAPTEKLITSAIKVNKAPLTVTVLADSYSRIYGDPNPKFYFEYSGFRNGDDEKSANFTSGLKEPMVECEATKLSPVGEGYAVRASGGESDNYYCAEFVDTAISIEKRPLDVTAIISGIPALTSRMIRENPGTIHTIRGYALNNAGQVMLDNLVADDVIRVSYDATYLSSDLDARDVTVAISKVELEDYGAGGNYYLRHSPTIAKGGSIYTQKISGVDIVTQPKTAYVYGEYIDLTMPGVKIVYDDGASMDNVPYDQLENYDIDLYITYVDEEGNEVTERALDLVERQNRLKDGETTEGKLKLAMFNGAYYTLVPKVDDTIYSPSLPTATAINSADITVSPKTVNVNIKSVNSNYGDDPTPKFAFEYGDDFVYGETPDEVVTTVPVIKCTDTEGEEVGVTTEIGEYVIKTTTAEAENYKFRYNNGTLTIKPRELIVSDITGGIPTLTADIIRENDGNIYYIPASATSSQMVCDRVNDDDIKITYNAVYSDNEKSDSYNVGIEDMELEPGYGRNKNYVLNKDSSIRVVEGGGKINDKEITKIEITEQPELSYTYGDKLNLSGGNVRIVYDTGHEDNIPFSELANYRITAEYYDTESATASGKAADNDKLTVPAHNGKVIRLTATSIHTVGVQYTEPVTVAKRVLEYGDIVVNAITFDGHTTSTTGTIVFKNVQYNENVTAKAVFNFDDFLAGENKTVYVTDIKLDSEWTANYSLSADSLTAKGTIKKARETLTLSKDDIYLSPEDNSITVNAPEMTETQKNGGAKYQYSIDGGVTWSDENVFTGLELGKDYDVCIRLAETDNYAATEPTESVKTTTYKVRFTLSSNEPPKEGEERRVLKRFYTDVESVENEAALKELIGTVTEIDENGEEKEIAYYTLYDAATGNAVKYPLNFIPEGEKTADMNIYASLTAPKRGNTGSSSSGTSFVGVIISYTDENGNESKASTMTVELGHEPMTLKGDASSAGKNAVVVWSSDNPDVVSVNSFGTVKFLKTGTATITASVKDVRNAESDTLEITVVDKKSGESATPKPGISSDKEMNIPYLHGYDGMIKPDDRMTRAEAATIMLQLIGFDTSRTYENVFPDVREGTWYIDIIAEAAARGLLVGYEDGTFRPEDYVTREQYAAIAVKLAGLEPTSGSMFDDVDVDRWSAGYINTAVQYGIIKGYEDGTFMPEEPIRRSEAVRMTNVATDRIPDKAVIDNVKCPYTDLPRSHWAYYEFMIAAVEYELP